MYWETSITQLKPGIEQGIPIPTELELQHNGYYRSTGLPVGQVADFRKALPDGRGIHIRIYNNRATAHWDRIDPSRSLIGHLLADAPVPTILATAGIAVLAGALSS